MHGWAWKTTKCKVNVQHSQKKTVTLSVIPILYFISALHHINQHIHNFFRIYNVLAKWRGINALHWNAIIALLVTTTTTKDKFSQCTLQQQRFSKSKSTEEALRGTFTIITGSLEISEDERDRWHQVFMYRDIMGWKGTWIKPSSGLKVKAF